MAIEPIFKPFSTRPATHVRKRPMVQLHALVRDQFPISTWLLLGALIQGTAHLFLPYRNIVLILPAILLLIYKTASALLQTLNMLPNPTMADVIPHRTALTFPSSKSGTQDTPGGNTVCAILLSVVSHHPLGMLAPGFKEVGDRFDDMIEQLSADATRYGFLGASAWMSTERTTSNETAGLLYFENEDYVHAYAHGPLHTEALQWWTVITKGKPYLGIMHEVFVCPQKSWEGVYLNYHPTGLGAASKEVKAADGKSTWVNPLVKAKGKLLYSNGRMGRAVGEKEWVEFEESLSPEDRM